MPVREDLRAKFAVHNPHNKPIDELPVIYGFNNGGSPGFFHASLIAEDGTSLGGHICSGEGFMYGDLGILNGFRGDRHETFRKHYPEGFRMDFVPYDEVQGHAKLMDAIQKAEVKDGEASAERGDRSADDASSVVR